MEDDWTYHSKLPEGKKEKKKKKQKRRKSVQLQVGPLKRCNIRYPQLRLTARETGP
jgi:hypothetical protein